MYPLGERILADEDLNHVCGGDCGDVLDLAGQQVVMEEDGSLIQYDLQVDGCANWSIVSTGPGRVSLWGFRSEAEARVAFAGLGE